MPTRSALRNIFGLIRTAEPKPYPANKGPWNERTASFVARRARMGKITNMHENQLVRSEQRQDFEWIERQLVELKRKIAMRVPNPQREASEGRIAGLQACAALSHALHGKKPHIFQVMAFIGMQPEYGGITGKTFKKILRSLTTLYIQTPSLLHGKLPWHGDPNNYYKTIEFGEKKMNMTVRIWDALDHVEGKITAPSELLETIGLESNVKNLNAANTALQFLELIGAVKKQPHTNSTLMWSSGRFAAIKRHINNGHIYALEVLSALEGGATSAELKTKYRNGQAKNTLVEAAEELVKLKLVAKERFTWRGSRMTTRYRITELGKELIKPWLDTPIARALPATYEKLRRTMIQLPKAPDTQK